MVPLGQGKFVNLRTILEGGRLNLERSRIEILINVTAEEPITLDFAIDVERKLLQAEMVRLVI